MMKSLQIRCAIFFAARVHREEAGMPSIRFAVVGCALFALSSSCAHQESPSEVGSSVKKTAAAAGQRDGGAASAVNPEDLVRKMSDFYKGLKSFEVRADREIDIQAEGMNRKMTTQTNVVFERPNRLAMRPEGDDGPISATVVSNGKTMYTLIGKLKRYTKREAPKTVGQVADDPLLSGGGGGPGAPGQFLLWLTADDPYQSIMRGVKTSKDLGATTLDGKPARHLQFTQDEFDWEAWIGTDPEPLLLEVAIDMSKLMRKSGQAPPGITMKLTMTGHFRDWKCNITPKSDAFVFSPPPDAKETNDLFSRGEREESPSPLLGKAAPPIDLELLDGKRFNLADHAGKDIVMLDMWATWCGPCRRELPLLAEIAHDYRSKGVAFYAVNLSEEKKTVDEFVKKENLNVNVALDSDGNVGNAYGADSIPLLVLIDKGGVVQAVHVCYSPDVQTILHKELDGLLAGKNLAAEAVATHKAKSSKAAAALKAGGLESAWAVSGPYSGVAWDPHSKSIFAIKRGSQCDVVGLDGTVKRSFHVDGDGSVLRLARLRGPDQADLLAFGTWGQAVLAFSTADGTVLWRENNDTGVDDVWAADLDGDGRDEVIIGYNGFVGLHVFGPDGRPRWKTTKIGNVWHVAAGDVNGDKKQEVVSTSAMGKVHVFAADGKPLATLDAPFYANGIRVARLSKGDAADTILVTGSSHSGESLAAIDGKGHALWTLEFPEGIKHVESLAVSPNRPWMAFGVAGRVLVADLASRKFVAAADVEGRLVEATWATAEDGQTPLLLVANGNQLSAFRVKPAAGGAASPTQPKSQDETRSAAGKPAKEEHKPAPKDASSLDDREARSRNNLKLLSIALHDYHDANQHYPPAVLTGPDGKTPHSWRVAILPYCRDEDAKKLAAQYNFREPWDGPTNRKLLERIPEMFRAPGDAEDSTNTAYFALTGPGTMFDGPKGVSIEEVTDGSIVTILLVEARRPVPWTKPVDIPYDASKPLPKLGGIYPGGFFVVSELGAPHFLSNDVKDAVLRALISRAGGEAGGDFPR
jgi:peroxiredoxin/outer membrane protein assembly factor BamB